MLLEQEQGKIYPAMVNAMRDINAIAKGEKNQKQGWMFRGIDTIYNELHSILSKNGIFMLPEVISDESEERTTNSGTDLIYRKLRIKYHFVAEDGSEVIATVQGEGMDSGDKASNKAMAIGHKYALLQAFLIPTEEQKDPDYEAYEPSKPKTPIRMPEPRPIAGIGKITSQEKSEFIAIVEKIKINCPPADWNRLIEDFGEPESIGTKEDAAMFLERLSDRINRRFAKEKEESPIPADSEIMSDKEKAEFLTKIKNLKKNCPPEDWELFIANHGLPEIIKTKVESKNFLQELITLVNNYLKQERGN